MTDPTVYQPKDCQWCQWGDACSLSSDKLHEDCPLKREREPTTRDLLKLMTTMMTAVNQLRAEVLLLINRHQHAPGEARR